MPCQRLMYRPQQRGMFLYPCTIDKNFPKT
nr:MAG TPA: hypothetical protein [Caudoviricetes sp.]